ncbi:MAG TPA: SDR family NAD(P)-dependent oxidoreductase [Pseudonocardiaceae bacterium]|nr:SDR family NAD(P)-dependent oxidoreductase [Pseudonocardiaceae bacterium]
MDLTKRTALVTGGGRGIGRAIALGLAGSGARVAVLARSAEQVEETVRLVHDAGGDALAVTADVTDDDAVAASLARIGPMDVLVNNAAVVWPLGPTWTVDPAEWAAAIAVNVTAVARLSLAVLPGMLDAGWGRIVNVSSGIVGSPGNMIGGNAYVTSKAALEAHSINLAAELAGTGVTVNVYRPGTVDTAMQTWIRDQDGSDIPELHQRFHHMYREGLLSTPEQSAAALVPRIVGTETGRIWNADDPVR